MCNLAPSRLRAAGHPRCLHATVTLDALQRVKAAALYRGQDKICDLTTPAGDAPEGSWDRVLLAVDLPRVGFWRHDPDHAAWYAVVAPGLPRCHWCMCCAVAYGAARGDQPGGSAGPCTRHACEEHRGLLHGGRPIAAHATQLPAGTPPAELDLDTPEGRQIAELYLRLRALEDEDSDGGWNGGDAVDILCDLLTAMGLDIDAPMSDVDDTDEVAAGNADCGVPDGG